MCYNSINFGGVSLMRGKVEELLSPAGVEEQIVQNIKSILEDVVICSKFEEIQ
jgi:hypothetical protein